MASKKLDMNPFGSVSFSPKRYQILTNDFFYIVYYSRSGLLLTDMYSEHTRLNVNPLARWTIEWKEKNQKTWERTRLTEIPDR